MISPRWRNHLIFFISLLFLNSLMHIHQFMQGDIIIGLFRPVFDTLMLVLITFLAGRISLRPPRELYLIVSLFYIVLAAYKLITNYGAFWLGQMFNPFVYFPILRYFLRDLFDLFPAMRLAIIIGLVILYVTLGTWLVHRALCFFHTYLAQRQHQNLLWPVAATLLASLTTILLFRKYQVYFVTNHEYLTYSSDLFLIVSALAAVWLALRQSYKRITKKEFLFLLLVVAFCSASALHLYRQGAHNTFFALETPYNRVVTVSFANHLRDALLREKIEFSESWLSQKTSEREAANYNLEALRGRNVYFIMIESYGSVVFRQPAFAEAAAYVKQVQGRLASLGFKMRTTLYQSTVQGAGSAMADMSQSCGLKVTTIAEYYAVLTSRIQCLPRYFNKLGHHTVVARPGVRKHWQAGQIFGFDKNYYLPDLPYRGRQFTWAPLSDQYLLDYVYRKELAASKKPFYAKFILVNGHGPWITIPPFIKNWSEIKDGKIYLELEPRWFKFNYLDVNVKEAQRGYTATMIYDFQVIESFLKNFVNDDSLVILMGDHEPGQFLTGNDPSHAVPMHFISRDRRLLQSLKVKPAIWGLMPESFSYSEAQSVHLFMQNFVDSFKK